MAINYPVDPNSRWSVWSVSQAKIIKHNARWPRADGMEVVGLDADLIPLMEVIEDQPVYDPATHYLTRSEPVVDVAANTHTHGWTVVARPQSELDSAAELAQIKAVYQGLKNGVGTATERLERVELVLARVLKDQYAAN